MIATLALVLSIAALLAASFQLSLWLAGKATTRPTERQVYISNEALLDQRSFLQTALRTINLHLESRSAASGDASQRVARLLTDAPLLIASPVIPDAELSRIERATAANVIWIVTASESIEFSYPNLGGSFSAVVMENVSRGAEYRYLVPDSVKARQRAASIMEDYSGIEVRFLDQAYWDLARRTVDDYVVYETIHGKSVQDVSGYYLYPGSNPRKWIRMDRDTAMSRLRDAEAQWELSG